MATNSKIEWCDHTFNPWVGCTKVSQGCANCYAETLMDKRFGRVQWGPQGTRVRTSQANWDQVRRWDRQAAASGRTTAVFCASLADVFEDRPELVAWRADLFALIDSTPHLTWLLLTKRPENVRRLWPFGWYDQQYTWPNVWIGTSIEDQQAVERRMPELMKIPSVGRFVSCEPLLGPVDLTDVDFRGGLMEQLSCEYGIDWVIVGGESGPGARPMHPAWVRSLRNQCDASDVPFFFKQWGAWAPDCLCPKPEPCATTPRPKPGWVGVMFRCGKKAAGRQLDGREWNQTPWEPA